MACVAGHKQVSRFQGITLVDINDVYLPSWVFIKFVSKTFQSQDLVPSLKSSHACIYQINKGFLGSVVQ